MSSPNMAPSICPVIYFLLWYQARLPLVQWAELTGQGHYVVLCSCVLQGRLQTGRYYNQANLTRAPPAGEVRVIG